MKFSKSFYIILTVAVSVAAIAIGWRLMVDRTTPEDATYVPKPFEMTPEIELLQRYLRIDTQNPPGNETAGARFLIAELQKRGVKAELIESAPGRGNVYARVRGRIPGEGLMLLSHIDVAPADPKGWKMPPFGGEIYLDMLVGRGALDMKSVTIAQLEAFADAAQRGGTPERDLVFLATADEEQGGAFGMAWLLDNRPDIFDGVAYALGEGGVTEMDREQVSYFGIETGTKQFVELRARAGSREALERARIALEPWFDPANPQLLAPEVRHYFQSVSGVRNLFVELLRDPVQAYANGKLWNLATPYAALMQNTLFIYGIEEEATGFGARVVLHNLPQADPDERIAWFRKAVAPYGVSVDVTNRMGPTRVAAADTPLYTILERVAMKVHGPQRVGPLLLPWATNDSRYLRARGIQAYGIWPFKVDYFQTLGIHASDERIRLSWFMEGVAMTRMIVMSWTVDESSDNFRQQAR